MLSENIKDLRKRADMTQEELAERLNVSRQVISKWETSRGCPKIENLVKMADLFQVSLDELTENQFTKPGGNNPNPERDESEDAKKDLLEIHEEQLSKIKTGLKADMLETSYEAWMMPLIPLGIDEQTRSIYFREENAFKSQVIKSRYLPLLEECVEFAYGQRYDVIISN